VLPPPTPLLPELPLVPPMPALPPNPPAPLPAVPPLALPPPAIAPVAPVPLPEAPPSPSPSALPPQPSEKRIVKKSAKDEVARVMAAARIQGWCQLAALRAAGKATDAVRPSGTQSDAVVWLDSGKLGDREAMPIAAPATDVGHIKGAAFREFVVWYAARFGREKLSRAVPAYAESFLKPAGEALGVLPNVWYPAQVVHDLLDGLVRDFDDAELERVAQEAANQIMSKTLRGVYRAIFNLLVTPDRYSRHIDKLWALHYDTGRPMIELIGPCEHRVRYVDWRSHHPFICRLNMSATVPIYSAMGCRDVSWTRVSCTSAGGAACINRVRWRE
jgi:hypothetical protein